MKTLIFGYGITGKAVEKYFKQNSKEYLIYDDNKDLVSKIDEDLVFNLSDKKKINEIVISPGIKPNHNLLKNFDKKIRIITDIDIFSKDFDGIVIGVTGTNGKTTFVNLLTEFLNANGIEAVGCGNVGVSPLSIDFKNKTYAIVELSSFQLYYSSQLRIDFGVFLNLHSDHLDWHKDEDEYKKSKLKLLSFLNSNSNLVTGINTLSKKNLEDELNVPSDTRKNEHLNSIYDLSKIDYQIDTTISFLKIIEKLNLDLSMGYKHLLKKVTSEHRFEFVDSINKTIFINDSKSTNFHSMSVATSKVKDALLIMHGETKNVSTKEINISNEVKKIIIPKNMDVNLKNLNFEIIKIDSILNLEKHLNNDYQNFTTILFSCGGSSFSDFKNYEERGVFFKNIVKRLKVNNK